MEALICLRHLNGMKHESSPSVRLRTLNVIQEEVEVCTTDSYADQTYQLLS